MDALTLQSGALLVEGGTTLPADISLLGSAFSPTWRSAPDVDGAGLEEQLAKSGWTLFYMAGIIQKRGFGFDAGKRVRAAVASIVEDVHAERCNCLEITNLTTKSFLGIPYVSITAHARHIQDGLQFRGR